MTILKRIKTLLPLHMAFFFYSFCAVLSKTAASVPFMSLRFVLFYGGALAILAVYSVIWQLLLRRYPLNVAYSSKGITVVWGIIWGCLFFGENINAAKVAAAAFVIAGIIQVGGANE